MPDSSRCQQLIEALMVPETCQEGFKSAFEAVQKCNRFHESQFTAFLDPETVGFVKRLRLDHDGEMVFFGGYDDAEYQMLGVFAPHEKPEPSSFPMVLMGFDYPTQFGTIAHKDMLGALMSLGLERKVFGDILVSEGHVQFLCKEAMVSYIKGNLEKVRHMGVAPEVLSYDAIKLPTQERKSVCFSVASLRLDAVVSAAFNLSRNQAVQFIKQGYVKSNYSVIDSPAHLVNQGDLISARRLGRFYVGEVQGVSKKGKLRLSGEKTVV